MLLVGFWARPAHAQNVLKPYIVFILDVSGSMVDGNSATGFGPPSCPGGRDKRLDHAKCAIQNIANSFGDMVMGFARFRQTSNDNDCSDGCSMSVACS